MLPGLFVFIEKEKDMTEHNRPERDPEMDPRRDPRRDPNYEQPRDVGMRQEHDRPVHDPDRTFEGPGAPQSTPAPGTTYTSEKGHLKAHDVGGNDIIDAKTGTRVGRVEDMLIDPQSMRVSAVVTHLGDFLNRDVRAIPANQVQTWGRDVILISGEGEMGRREDIPGQESFLSISDNLRGKTVVTTSGEKIGQINDVLMDDNGQIVAFELGSGGIFEGRHEGPTHIPANATRSLGQDVLIADIGTGHHEEPRP
jgi:uncharacterized protein YrrD